MVSYKMLLHNMLCASFDIRKGPTRGANGGMATRSLLAAPSGRMGACSACQGYQNKLGAWNIFKKPPSSL
jgi:hypothetical protein